jgi:phospholipid-translocating ATPase
MTRAVEEFFPDTDVPVKEGTATSDSGPYPLRRLSTGVPSIVGEGNGTRPGGYVLVIDGTALDHVGVTCTEGF